MLACKAGYSMTFVEIQSYCPKRSGVYVDKISESMLPILINCGF